MRCPGGGLGDRPHPSHPGGGVRCMGSGQLCLADVGARYIGSLSYGAVHSVPPPGTGWTLEQPR